MSLIQFREPIESPIFVLCCERSGSTLLRYILDTHAKICSPGELRLGDLCENLSNTLYHTLGQTLPAAQKTEIHTLIAAEVRSIVSAIMDSYAERKGKQIWCEKCPWDLMNLAIIEQVFPQARYICLFRNCMDVVHSCLEISRHGFMRELQDYAARNPENLVAAMIDSWTDKTTKIHAFYEAHPQRAYPIKYEDYVAHPEEVLPPLFEFLGVGWENGLIERVFGVAHEDGFGDSKTRFTNKISTNNIGKGSDIPYQSIPTQQRERMNALLQKLGYPTVQSDWDSVASPYRSTDSMQSQANSQSLPMQDIFKSHIPAKLRENKAALTGIRTSFKFVITGSEQAVWTVQLDSVEPQISAQDLPSDCTLTVDAEVLRDIIDAKTNPVSAYMEGKIRFDGGPEQASLLRLFL